MKLLDYWVLYLYHFVNYFKVDNTPWISARFYLSMFVFAFLMNVFNTIFLLMIRLNVCEEFVEFVRLGIIPIWMTLYILCGVVIMIYYRKDEHVDRIEKSYNTLSKGRQWVIKIFIYFLEIFLPIYLFISMRLVVFGQVKWWD